MDDIRVTISPSSPRLLDHLRLHMRKNGLAYRTEQTYIHPVYPEPRPLCRDGKVARGHQLTTRRGRDAMDLSNYRLRQRLDGQHHLGASGEQILKICLAAILALATGGHLLEIMAGAKPFSRSR